MAYATSNGARIFWEEEGAGAPVLLIMGFGYPGAMWYRLLPYLTDGYRAIWFDNRGVGATGVVDGPYSIERMAEDGVAVMDAAGVATAHVIGASMGGFIAQELALRHPERVRSLVLACTGPSGPEAVPPSAEARHMLGAHSTMSSDEAVEAATPFVYAPATPRERIEEDTVVRMRQPTAPEGYARQFQALASHGGTYERLPAIAIPTLVVHGAVDRLVDPANAKLLADRIPRARLVMIEGASHMLGTDQPEIVGRTMRAFLDEVVPDGAG